MASSHVAGDGRDGAAKQTRRSIWSGVLAGVGLVAFIDETVFHQLLHWHHFYDKSTLAVGRSARSWRASLPYLGGAVMPQVRVLRRGRIRLGAAVLLREDGCLPAWPRGPRMDVTQHPSGLRPRWPARMTRGRQQGTLR